MAKLVVLGSAASVPDESHDNTHMAVVGERGFVLIDCASAPVVRLKRAGLDANRLTDLVLTHFHPDHIYGVPLLLLDMWLMGRRSPLNVCGSAPCLDRLESLMAAFGWQDWPGFYPTRLVRAPEGENALLADGDEFRIWATPVRHLVPTLGLRLEVKTSGKVLAYSADTEPCPQVVRLGAGADLFVHEATGATLGHSSAAQAGQTARAAGAHRLLLIHYDVAASPESLAAEASQTFGGPVAVAQDFDVHEI